METASVEPQGHGQEFDLTSAVADTKKFTAGWRVFAAVFVVIGVAMAVLGSSLAILRYSTYGASYAEALGVVGAVGVIVAVGCWPLATQARAYPTSLIVSDREIVLSSAAEARPRVFLWSDPALKLSLIDRRGLPAVRPDGRPRHRFALQAGGKGPWTPIPEGAFNALLEETEAHKLQVTRHKESVRGTPGTFEEILIRGPRRLD